MFFIRKNKKLYTLTIIPRQDDQSLSIPSFSARGSNVTRILINFGFNLDRDGLQYFIEDEETRIPPVHEIYRRYRITLQYESAISQTVRRKKNR